MDEQGRPADWTVGTSTRRHSALAEGENVSVSERERA